MIKKTFNFFIYLFCFNLFISFVFTNTRVAFSRPGTLIRVPTFYDINTNNQYTIGFSNELVNTNTNNRAQSIYLHGISLAGIHYGVAYSTHAQKNKEDSSPPSEFSFHLNQRIYDTEKMQIIAGVQDVLFTSSSDHELSLFVSLINKGAFLGEKKQYYLESGVGFGSGKINNDSHHHSDVIAHKARFFVGLNLKTSLLKNRGGINFMLDFDGKGTHLGTKIPVNSKLRMNFALTNFQNMSRLNKYQDIDTELIYPDSPGIAMGLDFVIPSKKNKEVKLSSLDVEFQTEDEECIITQAKEFSSNPLSLDKNCKDKTLNQFVKDINNNFNALNDSIKVIAQETQVYETTLLENNYQINMLQDSINIQYLKHRISKSELNIAMKHLSQSLQYFYLEDYLSALNQVEEVINRFPSLAIAYARKGTIYYQMGDFQNATLNWNLALKHDPEYIEVQNMLLGIKRELEEEY
tara:strand:- start:294 stop:1685 length:1392 start_codon:yes stop_codon:yes gene_type:complete